MAELVSGAEPDAAAGHAARSEVAKVRRADYDLKLEPQSDRVLGSGGRSVEPLGFVGSGAAGCVLTW